MISVADARAALVRCRAAWDEGGDSDMTNLRRRSTRRAHGSLTLAWACAIAALGLAVLLSGPRTGRASLECDPENPEILCDDADPCTVDTCTSAGGVFSCHNDPVNCLDDDPCTIDSCSPVGDFLCVHDPDPLCAPECGNGVVDPGETCDPPGLPAGANLNPCRPDCTVCGDSIVQAPETCDDGNTVSGCDPQHLQVPLDACQNNCTPPVCGDPSKIKFGTVLDELKVHGRLILTAGGSVDMAGNQLVVELTNGQAVIFRSSLLENLIAPRTNGGFKFKNKGAKTDGGIGVVTAKRSGDSYKVLIVAYGELGGAISDMTSRIHVGARQWTTRGLWQQTAKGWKLNAKSTFLQP